MPMPKSATDLLERHFQRWSREPNYLGLDERHYDLRMPPMLFLGGDRIAPCGSPLVIVSIEPLVADHFEVQRAYATQGLEQYSTLNLRLFEKLPELAGRRTPQPYFSNLFDFVAGWSGEDARTRRDPWDLFGRNVIEIPYVPMHARHWEEPCEGARELLGALFSERIGMVASHWPRAGFMILGASIVDALAKVGVLRQRAALVLPPPVGGRQELGNKYFDVPLETYRLSSRDLPLLARRGSFSQGHNPQAAGRRELGRQLRAVHDESAVTLSATRPSNTDLITGRREMRLP